ncbi:MAG: outer membrane beta-barrel protein, partial [Bacteroidota bacterium]
VLDASLNRATLSGDDISQLYDETDTGDSDETQFRSTFRAQYDVTDRTQLVVEPRITVQDAGSIGTLLGVTSLPSGEPLASTTATTDESSLALLAQGEIRLRHRFPARGRTLSLSLDGDLDTRGGETVQTTEILGTDDASLVDQLFDADALTRSVAARLSYTEPLGESSQLQLNYRPSLSRSTSDQLAFLADASGGYTIPDAAFTSAFEQRSVIQRGGASYRYNTRGTNVQLGVDLQHETLTGEQTAPEAFDVDRSFVSVLPSARARFTLGEGRRLSLDYRARTQTPSATQLRSLVDNSNPLLLTTGNPDLDPSTQHTVRARMNSTDASGGAVLFGFISGTYGQDYIGTSTILARTETTTPSGVVIPAGSQLTRPENVDGYWNARGLVSYGRPLALIKSNANVSLGASYTRAPGLVNDARNVSDQIGLDGRLFIGSAISPRLDFSLEYGARYSAVTNSDAPTLDNTTVLHRGGGALTWLPWDGITLATRLDGLYYAGIDETLDPSQVLWGAKIGYKFLPGDLAEVSLSVTDILDQQQDLQRTVTELYIQDEQTRALGRYVMLNLSYKLRDFGQGNASGGDRRGPRGDRRPGGFGRGD